MPEMSPGTNKTFSKFSPSPQVRIAYVAEIGTLQLEFMRLSQLTGDPIWAWKVSLAISLRLHIT